jgi:hypothetical protein
MMKTVVQSQTGRLIGLFPGGSGNNVLWTHAAPGTVGWPNHGGDRTWVAPEIELFIGDLSRPMETYRVPPALDPGNWVVTGDNTLVNTVRLPLLRTGGEVSVRIEKSYGPAANPLPSRTLQYAGYTQETCLQTDGRLAIWNLLQLPPGGTMLVATRGTATPRIVFGKLADGELLVRPGLVTWKMAATGLDAKIALQSVEVTGRAGYLRVDPATGLAELVVREFAVDPSGEYLDALWEHPHETGWAFQACCVRNGSEHFNELEYHAPVGCRRDESRVWAFRGPKDAVRGAAVALLGGEGLP